MVKIMNSKKFLLLVGLSFCLFIFNQTAFSQTNAKLKGELVGIWHASPSVGSGMNDLYRFFADGKFVFEYNQMIGAKRTISFSGKWRIQNQKLILTITKETVIIGGKRVKSEGGSLADGYEIEGGKEITRTLKPAKTETKILGKLQQGELTKFISIGKKKYWRLSGNPNDYGN